MTRLTRYVLRQSFGVTMFITLGLTAAIWLIGSLRLIDFVVNRGVGLKIFGELSILTLPQWLAIVLPVALVIAVIFTYNKLTADSELIVMRATGLSQFGLAAPGMAMALIGTAMMLSLTLYLLPASKNEFKDLQFRIRNQFTSVLLQDGQFNTVSDTLTVYVRARDANGELLGLLIQDTRDPARPVTLTAERGAIVQTETAPRVLMLNGTRQTYNTARGELQVLSFERNTLDLGDFRDAPGARQLQPDERYVGDLFAPSDADTIDQVMRTRLTVEGHQRLLAPLYCISFTLVGLACLLTGELNRRGQGRRLLVAFSLVLVLQATDIGFNNLSNRAPLAIILMYLNVIVPSVISTYLVLRPRAFRRRPIVLASVGATV
ncbi:MAG TPA: LPS export ABC transporter permease LptF [Stellaceae bacterium]|nr:LPS export ABC transporter permease LptF [Stellaceae bacterium]